MKVALTLAGALFELIGLGLVLYELHVAGQFDAMDERQASREEGPGSPWVFIGRRKLDALKRHPALLSPSTPGESDRQRIRRLEYAVRQLADRVTQEAFAAAEYDDKLHQTSFLAGRFERSRRKRSMIRQVIGATCLFLGLALGTLGNLA